ncbi:MAG: hypothetical protein WCK29_01310 [archaeon]
MEYTLPLNRNALGPIGNIFSNYYAPNRALPSSRINMRSSYTRFEMPKLDYVNIEKATNRTNL